MQLYQGKDIEERREIGLLKNMNVRFFLIDNLDNGDVEQIECTEAEFIAAPGHIEYERHTIFQNGVSQIVLTKSEV